MQVSKQSAPPNESALAEVIEVALCIHILFAVAEVLLPNHTHATTVLTIYGCLLYFCPVVCCIFFSLPNLSHHRLDVCHTSTHGVALVRI